MTFRNIPMIKEIIIPGIDRINACIEIRRTKDHFVSPRALSMPISYIFDSTSEIMRE